MTKGTAQLMLHGDIDMVIQAASNKMKQGLSSIEALNLSFIRQASTAGESGFSGEFRNAFVEKTEQELELIQILNEENLERLQQMVIKFDQLLFDISYQDYVYETELLPMVKK